MKKRGHNDFNSPGDAIKPLLAKDPTQNIRLWIESSNTQKIAISLACASIGSVFYFWSLMGGTDKFLMTHAKEIIAYFLLALISYELAFIFIFKIDGWKSKISVGAIVVTLLYYTLQYDQGASFDHHGEYNIVAFACLFTLTSFIIASVYIIRRYRKLREFAILLVLIFLYFNFKSISVQQNYPKGLFGDRINNDIEGICQMPQITPWVDFLPRRFFNFFTGSERCSYTHKPFSFFENNVLTIDCDEDAFYTINANFTARDKFIEYHESEPIETSDLRRLWNDVKYQNIRRKYTGPVRISEGEYILCECGKFQDYHMQNVYREEIESEAKKKRPQNAKYNVMVVLFDSTSRAHFKRRLPRSAKVIEKLDTRKGGDFEVFQFHRYHALSFATPGNLRPLIAGMKSEELRSMRPKASDFFMWKPYKENGYVNMYIHNLCQDNFKNYFYDNTTNVYMDYDVVLPFCHYEYADSSGMYSNFRGGPYSIERRCINERYVHSYTFEYMTEFMENYRESPKFIFTHMIEAHESSGSVLSTVDGDFAVFVENTMREHPNTLLVITSDHGLKVGPYSLSPAGKVENQNPVLYTIFPKSFIEEHPQLRETLKHNEQALATHFDLHKTILQFRDFPKLVEPDYSNFTYSHAARTLFEKIPYSRTCEDAGMSDDKPCLCTGRIL